MTRGSPLGASGWLLILSIGCERDKGEAVAASYSSVTRPVPVVAPPASAVGVARIPVEEEYEERAAKTIEQANVESELLELERELRSDSP